MFFSNIYIIPQCGYVVNTNVKYFALFYKIF